MEIINHEFAKIAYGVLLAIFFIGSIFWFDRRSEQMLEEYKNKAKAN